MTAVISACIKKIIKIGEFLCSHFNIEDGRKYVTFLTYYALLSQESNWNAKKICSVYGDSAVTGWTWQEWFVEFCDGDFLLNNAPQSRRQVKVHSDQINTLLENNQHYTIREIAGILKISKSIKLLVKMKDVSFILWKKTKWTFWPTQQLEYVFTGRVNEGLI